MARRPIWVMRGAALAVLLHDISCGDDTSGGGVAFAADACGNPTFRATWTPTDGPACRVGADPVRGH